MAAPPLKAMRVPQPTAKTAPVSARPLSPTMSSTAMFLQRTSDGSNQRALATLEPDKKAAAGDTAPAAPHHAPKLPPLSDRVRSEMIASVEEIVRILKKGTPSTANQTYLLDAVRKWEDRDHKLSAQERGGRRTPMVDHFLILLKSRAYSRITFRIPGFDSLTVEQHAIVYDSLWYELRGYWLQEFKRVVKSSETQRTEGAQSADIENGAALIAKQEAMGLWGMLKGLGTGLVSMAGPEATKYIGEQFDETAHILFGHEWDSSEPLVWGMNAAQIGTAGGDIIMQLTLFARSAGAKGGRILELLNNLDKFKKAQQVLAGLGGVQGMLMATQGMMQLIEAKQAANEEISVAALINDPAFVNQLVMLVSSGVGTALAVKGTPASAQQAWTRAIVGGLLAGGQVAASLNELVHIARSKDSAVEKELGYGRVLSGLIPQLVGLVISAHGANQARKDAKTERKAVAQTKADAAAQAQQEKQQELAAAAAPGKTETAAETTAETPAGQKNMSQPAEPGAAKLKPSLKEIEKARLKVGDAHQTQMADEVSKRLAPRDAPPVNAEVAAGQREPLYQAPKRGSTTVGEPHASLAAAQALYDKVVAETGAKREVGIWHHPDTGEYIVRLGQATSVDPPGNTEWQGVLHFHPNQADVPLWRMPSGADISELASRAMAQGRTRTELVEYPLPNGKRGRAAYTVSPEGKLTVEFIKPDGTRATKTFDGVKDFASYHPSRKVFDAESIRAEVDQWLADRRQGTSPEAEAGSKNMSAQSKQDSAPWDLATAKKQWATSEKKTVSAEESKKWQDKVPPKNELVKFLKELGAKGPITSGELVQLYRHGSRDTIVKYLKQYLRKQAADPASKGVLSAGDHSMKLAPGVPVDQQIDAFVKNLEGAHSTPQSVSKRLPKDVQKALPGGKANPDDALVILTGKATHTAMDQPWKDSFDSIRKSGVKEATGQRIFDEVASGIRKTPGMSEGEKTTRIARLHNEMFQELGIEPGRTYPIPMIFKWWEVLAAKAKGK